MFCYITGGFEREGAAISFLNSLIECSETLGNEKTESQAAVCRWVCAVLIFARAEQVALDLGPETN